MASGAQDAAGKYEEARVRAVAGGETLHVRGRVVSLRSTGGLTFPKLRDRTGEIQLFVSEATLGPEYARLEDIEVADVIEAEGTLTASKRGELSIDTKRLRLLTKAYRPLPEKWHGLTDVELRYRQRYVDLVANPPVADVFRARSHIVSALRAVLDEHGFLEVETPTMHTLIGGAVAKPFLTHHNALGRHEPLHAHRAGRASISSASSWAAWSACTRSGGATATRGSARGTTPSSRCWSSTRRTRRTRT